MAGVKETKEIVELGLYVGVAIKNSLEDGKISIEDIGNAMLFVPKIGPAFDSIDKVPEEIKDLDVGEVQDILDLVKSKLGDITDNEKATEIASAALRLGLNAAHLVAAIKA